MSRPRITDVNGKPPRLIDSADIAADVERFLAAGGLIERPAFRRDYLMPIEGKKSQAPKWRTPPPESRELAQRGGKRK